MNALARFAVCTLALALCLLLTGTPACADQVITATQDYEFTLEGQDFSLHAGETFKRTGNRYTITDSEGKVVQEGELGDREYWFTASRDGYDERVGGGRLLLKAGYKYLASLYEQEQVEVRQASTDELVGYALLISQTTPEGALGGFEEPVTFVDRNSDGLVSVSEMNAAMDELKTTAGMMNYETAAPFLAQIASAEDLVRTGDMAKAYTAVKDVNTAIESQQRRAYALGAGVIALLVVVAVALCAGLVLKS